MQGTAPGIGKERLMENCTFTDFLETLKPWLSNEYVHRAKLDAAGRLLLLFPDGGQRMFEIDRCTRSQLENVVELFRQNGIQVEL
jgi:hypothetical protein